jgi:hypothetical protein
MHVKADKYVKDKYQSDFNPKFIATHPKESFKTLRKFDRNEVLNTTPLFVLKGLLADKVVKAM